MENKKLKRLLFLPLLLVAFISFGQGLQDGGAIQARDNPGVRGQIKRNLFALEVYDSIINQRLLTLIAGINVSGSISVSNFPAGFNVNNFPASQAVTAVSLPLPTGASTSANQTSELTKLDQLHTDMIAAIPAGANIIGKVGIDQTVPGATNAVQVTNQPANPATSTNQSTEIASLNTIDAGIPAALGLNTAANSMPVNIATDQLYAKVTGQSAQTAVVNNILTSSSGSAATDVTGYRSFSIQVVSTATAGTFIFEGSNDNVTFQTIPVFNQLNSGSGVPTTAAIAATASGILYTGSISYTFIRLRIVTTLTGGSVQTFSFFSSASFSPTIQAIVGNNQTLSVTPGASAAAAEGTANITAGMVRSFPFLWNGSNWDRPHGNWNTTTTDAGSKTTTFNGVTQTNFDSKGAEITVLCGTVTGTVPTLNVQLQYSFDAGTTWLNLGPATSNITATGNTAVIQIYPTNFSTAGTTPATLTTGATTTTAINAVLPRTWRLVYALGGTTPNFSITAVYVNYQM